MKITFKTFNENNSEIDIEQYLLDLIDVSTKKEKIFKFQKKLAGTPESIDRHDLLIKTNPEYKDLYDTWRNLIGDIINYYKNKLENLNDETAIRKLHQNIMNSLKRNNEYKNATSVICFDLTSIAINLIKNIFI